MSDCSDILFAILQKLLKVQSSHWFAIIMVVSYTVYIAGHLSS